MAQQPWNQFVFDCGEKNYLGKSYPVKIKIIKNFTGVISNIAALRTRTATTEFNFVYISSLEILGTG